MSPEDIEKKWHSAKFRCKPCPECGSQHIGLYHYRSMSIGFVLKIDIYFVSCKECGSCGKDKLTINGAIRAWNKHKRWKE